MAREVLRGLGCQRGELSILLVSDGEIEVLNREFLGREGPTDVLSFPMGEGFEGVPSLLGDVVISTETALRQAKERGLTFHEELTRLLIHGILHIFGFDHGRDEDAMVMEKKEKGIFKDLQEKGLI